MIELLRRVFGRKVPVLSDAGPQDADPISVLHAAAFRHGWSAGEVEALLLQANVVGDRALIGAELVGFILSRQAADEAEILSIAVAAQARGAGVGRQLLRRNLQRLAALGVTAVFLEVGADNAPALRLYARMGFSEVGRRERYYHGEGEERATALVLRRELR